MSPKIPTQEGAPLLGKAPAAATFFADSSFFDEQSANWWIELLDSPDRIVVPPHVEQEIAGWASRSPQHPAARAMTSGASRVEVLDLEALTRAEKNAFLYYTHLLAVRKKVMGMTDQIVPKGTPNKREELHRMLGARGYMLAKKGEKLDWSKATAYTDEALVVLAAMNALSTGEETIVLTRDEDVMEQLYKLIWFMDTHYRGMLVADRYAHDFGSFIKHGLKGTSSDIEGSFESEDGFLYERTDEFLEDVLPHTPRFVGVHCWLLRRSERSQMIFGAERQMERLVYTKGKTGGLNTDLLNGRNCHIWLAPMAVPTRFRGCGIIARERRVQMRGTDVSLGALDINQSISTMERFRHGYDDSPEEAVFQ